MVRSARLRACFDNLWVGLVVAAVIAIGASLWASYAAALPWHMVLLVGGVSFIALTLIIDKARDALRRSQPLSDKIQQWILETNIGLAVEQRPGAQFCFRLSRRDGRIMFLGQPAGRDALRIETGIGFTPDITARLEAMDKEKRDDLVWALRLGLLQMGVDYTPIDWPLVGVELSVHPLIDSLTKKELLEKISLLDRSLVFFMALVTQHTQRGTRNP